MSFGGSLLQLGKKNGAIITKRLIKTHPINIKFFHFQIRHNFSKLTRIERAPHVNRADTIHSKLIHMRKGWKKHNAHATSKQMQLIVFVCT